MSSKTKAGKKAPEKGKTTAEPSSSSESKSAAAETTSATESKTAKPETSSENKTPDKAAGKSASARPISYFSSVSTDEYRSGWDDIFQNKAPARPKRAANGKKKANALPATIELSVQDLDDTLRLELESLFRRQAKRKRLNYDKLAASGQVNWRIACEIGD